MATVYIGGGNARCAIAAGYAHDPEDPVNSITGNAHRIANDEKVQAAMLEVGLGLLGAGRIPAVKFILDTINNPQVEIKDRIKAAEIVMNRTGMHATTEHKVAVTHKDESGAEMIKQITQMAKALGVDPQKLLGNVVEAEFTEVGPEEDSIEDIL